MKRQEYGAFSQGLHFFCISDDYVYPLELQLPVVSRRRGNWPAGIGHPLDALCAVPIDSSLYLCIKGQFAPSIRGATDFGSALHLDSRCVAAFHRSSGRHSAR